MDEVTIYHNPECGTSRNTLAMIRNAGIEPTVIEYLREPPAREVLSSMISAARLTVRQALREKRHAIPGVGVGKFIPQRRTAFGCHDGAPDPDQPAVCHYAPGTRLCRPSEVVLEILPAPQKGSFTKEDGEIVVAERGLRVDRA